MNVTKMKGCRQESETQDSLSCAGFAVRGVLTTLGLLGALFTTPAFAADAPSGVSPAPAPTPDNTVPRQTPTKLNISLGKSNLVNLDSAISRVAVGNPAVADVQILNLRQVYILGKGIGSTNVMLWDKAGKVLAAFDVYVNLNVDQLNDEVRKLVKEGDIRVRAVRDRVILEGRVPDQDTSARVVEVVQTFGHKDILNLLKVDALPQPVPGKPAPAVEQIEVIRGMEITTKQFKAPQE